ncbi:GDP-mannose mannosyl hydrolase [Vibrio campbellii]|uniref:GDP-mannose mannosyl hydrolase n=1 Tax=Vibrio campbellii TaxID=680 RepID=UPI001F2DFF82|nr:GDP-mannose mannosyl hydrolase [Vibrio campbellii]MCE7728134.1 GDP-mannose mannosyl hydrolase [Vibrio campbellii]
MLDINIFKTVVASTPLISIDLVIRNVEGKVLLGKRKNRPAKGFWFVPGGRILKDEKLDAAFQRITDSELGNVCTLSAANFIGVYEHLYQDNFSSESFSTHYVVLGYELVWKGKLSDLPLEQHGSYQWWDVNDLLTSKDVHCNTKAYFSNYSLI